jgi:ABC-type sugar transport system substrate-binding protein
MKALIFAAAALASITAAHAADRGLIGVSVPNVKGPWYTPELFGITNEAKKLGYDVVIQDSGGYGNVDKQLTQMSNLIVQKAKAIIVDPADPTAFNGVAREARAAGVFILGAGVTVVAPDVPVDAAASSNHCDIGRELAKGAKKLLPNGGTAGLLAGPPGAFWSADRLKCFKEDLAGSNITVVAEQTSEQDPAVNLTLANDILQRFPNINLLYGADDTYGVGAARAVQAVGKCGKVKVVFPVFGEAAEEMMRAGCVDWVVAQQPVVIGRTLVDLADRLIKGEKLEKNLIGVPLIPVTPQNVDSIDKGAMQAPKGWTP